MNMPRITPRLVFVVLFAVAAGLLSFGLYLQHVMGVEPCPLCILQRYAFVACGLVALLAALHNPGPLGVRIYGGLMALMALTGGGIAARQSWIQRFPPQVSECGPDLGFMLDSFPLSDALPMIFHGAGDCSTIDWTFLGGSIANWSLLSFSAYAVIGLVLALRRWR
ncbi:MAG: disulfide bond formation protein B [Zoogloea sp.]|nr:disulfide bond formation protein B [Zoogloea sp.]